MRSIKPRIDLSPWVRRVRGFAGFVGSQGSWVRRRGLREATMTYVVEILRQEHRNIEKMLRVLERELSVFDRGDRPNYEVVLGVIDYFKDYPDSCHHPKEDIIFE
jgi:hypothetical protein